MWWAWCSISFCLEYYGIWKELWVLSFPKLQVRMVDTYIVKKYINKIFYSTDSSNTFSPPWEDHWMFLISYSLHSSQSLFSSFNSGWHLSDLQLPACFLGSLITHFLYFIQVTSHSNLYRLCSHMFWLSKHHIVLGEIIS